MASTAAATSSSSRHREQRLVDLDVLAAGGDQHPEIVAKQLAEIVHHLADVVVVFVICDLRQHVRAGHRDLDRLGGERGHHLELVDQPEIDRLADAGFAGSGRMEHVGVVFGDRLGPGAALEGWDLLPEDN